MLKLHTYFRSSAAYRVRIALNLKNLDYESLPVHLLRNGGEQHAPRFAAVNPAQLVPVLQDDHGTVTQSLAIIEYLDEAYPGPRLLPAEPLARARVRALALGIACEIHPLNNLRVLRYLKSELGADDDTRDRWYRHWIATGFDALERMLATSPQTGRHCHGDAPGLADCFLVPQVFNARRLDCPLDAYPTIRRIEQACLQLEAFRRAAPGAQPDADS